MTECRNAALRLLFMPSKLLAEISLGSTSISVFEILLSAKPYKSESNFLNGRSWAYFLYLTSPLSRFQVLREGIPMLRRA